MYPINAKPDRSTYVFHTFPSVTTDLNNAGNLQTNHSRASRSVHQPFLKPGTSRTRKVRINNENNTNLNERSISWKVIWGITVFLCSVVCFYQIADRVTHFFNEPVSANVELITNTSMQFPAFTLCPPMPYRFVKLYNLYLKKKLDPKKDRLLDVTLLVNMSDFYDLASYGLQGSESATHAEIVMYLALSNMPSAGGVVRPVVTNLSTYAGKCVTATFDKPTLYQGVSTMFKIFFSADMSVTKNIIIRKETLDVDKIATVYLHEKDDDAVHIAPVSSFKLLRGYTTTISMDVKEYKFLNRKKSSCISQSEANICKGDCVARQVLPHLKCRVPMDFQQLLHLPLCNDSKSFRGFIKTIAQVYTDVSSMNNCTTKCARKCEQTVYIMNVQYLSKSPRADITFVDFYFSDNVFERVEEFYTYGIINLLCDMGGNLGLFLGFSLLTLLDIIRSLSNGVQWLQQKKHL